MKYYVGIREVHIRNVTVEADSEEHAKEIADGPVHHMDDMHIEYSHDLDKELWSVELA